MRKTIQISAQTAMDIILIFALCDDGAIFRNFYDLRDGKWGDWREIPEIPQDEWRSDDNV